MPDLSYSSVALFVVFSVAVGFPLVMMIRAGNEKQWRVHTTEDGTIDRVSWGLVWVFVTTPPLNAMGLCFALVNLWESFHTAVETTERSTMFYTILVVWCSAHLWEWWRLRRAENLSHFRTELDQRAAFDMARIAARRQMPGVSYPVGGLVRPPPRPLPRPGSQAEALVESLEANGMARTSKNGESLTEIEVGTFRGGHCPDCGHSGLLAGPEGPGAQNVMCGNEACQSRFNVRVMGFGIDRISDARPSAPTGVSSSETGQPREPPTRFERLMDDT